MLRRFSSRRASLYEEFPKERLASAKRYDLIAGYFQSSLLDLANEEGVGRLPISRLKKLEKHHDPTF